MFSVTWPAFMQIYWNKRKRLHKKGDQLPHDWFGTPTWPPFHCFGAPIWPPWRHVKTLSKPLKPRSIEPRHLTGPVNNRGFRETGPGHKGPVIIYRLRGVGGRILGRITSFIAEQKGRSLSVVTENPKGGIAENFGRIQRRGDHSYLLGKWRHGGDRESHQKLWGGITFKGVIG